MGLVTTPKLRALPGQEAIHSPQRVRHHAAAGGDVDVVGTVLAAGVAAAVAVVVIEYDVERLQLGLAVADLEHVAKHAERSQQHPPGDIDAQQADAPPDESQKQQGQPEAEGVGGRPERADVAAEEALDEEASQHHDHDCDYAHPEHDLTLEPGGYCIIGVELAAEQLAGRRRGIEYPEEQAIFKDTQEFVPEGAALDFQASDAHALAGFGQQVFDRADGAEVGAEQLSEQHHRGCEQYAHKDLG